MTGRPLHLAHEISGDPRFRRASPVAGGRAVAALAAPFDLGAISLSKGLGAPGGSVLAGSRAHIDAAVRYRRMAGGAMRQVGIFAAAGLYALDHHVERLVVDHENARRIAERVASCRFVRLDPGAVRTDILVIQLSEEAPDAQTSVTRARERGVLLFAFGPRTLRAVTHLDVSATDCVRAGDLLLEAIGG